MFDGDLPNLKNVIFQFATKQRVTNNNGDLTNKKWLYNWDVMGYDIILIYLDEL